MDEFIGTLEKDALIGVLNVWTHRVADDLSKMINKVLAISGGTWKVVETQSLKDQYPVPRLVGSIEFEGQQPFYVLMEARDAAVLVDLFMGGDGTGVTEEFSEIQLGILEEMVNQMGSSLLTTLSELLSKKQKILPPKVQVNGLSFLPPQLLSIMYQMRLGDLLKGPFVILLGMQHAMDLAASLVSLKPQAPKAEAPAEPKPVGASVPAKASQPEEREILAKPAQFPQLTPQIPMQKVGNLDLIMDVMLQLTAVLGRTGISIRDLVELGPGSVLELDKLAGETVELYANNKLVAKGEVVVIDERFAIRVTETVSPMEALQGLRG